MLVSDANVLTEIEDVGDQIAKSVTNILKLSPTHFVSNIRHLHRCSPFLDLIFYMLHSELHFIMEKIRAEEPDATIHIIDCFTLWLTRERRKGEKSKFKKYFDTLPEEFSVPLTMSEEEFQLLPRQLKRRAERERIRLGKRFDYLKCITKFNFEGRVLRISEI